MKGFREFTLENGLRVALMETNVPVFSAQIRVHNGALSEQPGEEGYAHFLEHSLMNGGTEKYTPKQGVKLCERFAESNASTSIDQTIYRASGLLDTFELYLDLFSDIVFNPRFDQVSVDEERRRVLREMADNKSGPDYQDWRKFRDALWGADAPWIYQVLGKEEVIANATPGDFRKFHARVYHANNADLIMAGTLPPNAEELIRKYLEKKQTGNNAPFVFPKPRPLERRTILHGSAPDLMNRDHPEQSSASLHMGFIVPPYESQDYWPLLLANQILCGGKNSKIFQTVSRRKGIAYRISGKMNGDCNAGRIYIDGKVQATRLDEAVDLIFAEIDGLKQHGVNQEELTRIQRNALYGFTSMLANPEFCVKAIEKKLDYGWTIESYLAKINSVTSEQVLAAANKYLPSKDGKYVLLIRDPLKKD